MLVSRENSGDCRSEPDSTMQLAGGSQDRLAVPAMPAPIPSSPVAVVGAVTGAVPVGSPALTTGDSSPTDPAVRRRRLSNLYKVILTFLFFFFFHNAMVVFPLLSRHVITFWLLILSLVFLSSWYSSFCTPYTSAVLVFHLSLIDLCALLGNRSRALSTLASVSTVWRNQDRRSL